MAENIAVYLGADEQTTRISKTGKIYIMENKRGKWIILREKEFDMKQITSMQELRKKITEMIRFLDDCKIFAAHTVAGVPYFLMEKANIKIWECRGKPESFLDFIWEAERRLLLKQVEEENEKVDFEPVEVSPGNFQVSLKKIQEKNCNLTSKQVLLPFFQKNTFKTLELECSHLPPWLEQDILAGKYNQEVLDSKSGTKKVLIISGAGSKKHEA